MEKLWSPWRSAYIDSFNLGEKTKGCIFCESAGRNIDDENSLIVNKGKLTFTILNLYPYNNGHLMIVPYKHTGDFTSLTKEENLECIEQLQLAVKVLKLTYNPEGFNMGANLGRVSGAGIYEHIHFHLVPRWNGDTNFMPVLGEVKVISQDLMISKEKLLKAYQEIEKII